MQKPDLNTLSASTSHTKLLYTFIILSHISYLCHSSFKQKTWVIVEAIEGHKCKSQQLSCIHIAFDFNGILVDENDMPLQ